MKGSFRVLLLPISLILACGVIAGVRPLISSGTDPLPNDTSPLVKNVPNDASYREDSLSPSMRRASAHPAEWQRDVMNSLRDLRLEVERLRGLLEERSTVQMVAEDFPLNRPVSPDEWSDLMKVTQTRVTLEDAARNREWLLIWLSETEERIACPELSDEDHANALLYSEHLYRALQALNGVRTLRDLRSWRYEFNIEPPRD